MVKMKTSKHGKKRQQQEQSGGARGVLVTSYVVRPRKRGGGAAAAPSRDVHHHHHHHHLHSGAGEARHRGSSNDGRYYDRRAYLLEYSRQLRAMAATAAPPPRHCNIDTVAMVRHGRWHQPAADDGRLIGRRRLKRERSQQQVRQSCFGGSWNWKRVLMLLFPINVVGRNKSKRPTSKHGNRNDGETDGKAWPAALLVGKLKALRKYAAKAVRPRTLQVGDMVLRRIQDLLNANKLSSHSEGPYTIVSAVCSRAVRLAMEDGRELSSTWNIDQLQKFYV